MVRAGTVSDIPEIVEMAYDFWHHTPYKESYDPLTVERVAAACIEQELMSVVQVNGVVVGFACGMTGALLGNGSIKTGCELAWWVQPEHRQGRNGIALLKHIERQAKNAGVKYWNMVYMESSMPETIKNIYEKLGYFRTEVIYTKVL